MIRILKYIFLSYLLIILYAASVGRESVPSNLLKEYFIFMSLLIMYDLLKYIKRHNLATNCDRTPQCLFFSFNPFLIVYKFIYSVLLVLELITKTKCLVSE